MGFFDALGGLFGGAGPISELVMLAMDQEAIKEMEEDAAMDAADDAMDEFYAAPLNAGQETIVMNEVDGNLQDRIVDDLTSGQIPSYELWMTDWEAELGEEKFAALSDCFSAAYQTGYERGIQKMLNNKEIKGGMKVVGWAKSFVKWSDMAAGFDRGHSFKAGQFFQKM